MPDTLVINNYAVPISATKPPTRTTTEYGDFTQSVDGTDLGVIVGTKWMWTVTTPPMLQADADAMIAILQAGPRLASYGDLLGPLAYYYVRCQQTGYEPIVVKGGGYRIVVTFSARQS